MLPLAPTTCRGVLARFVPSTVDGFDDSHERNPRPGSLVLDDCSCYNYAWHGSGHKMCLAILAGNSFATVGHVVGVQFDHEMSVSRLTVSTKSTACIFGPCGREVRRPDEHQYSPSLSCRVV